MVYRESDVSVQVDDSAELLRIFCGWENCPVSAEVSIHDDAIGPRLVEIIRHEELPHHRTESPSGKDIWMAEGQ